MHVVRFRQRETVPLTPVPCQRLDACTRHPARSSAEQEDLSLLVWFQLPHNRPKPRCQRVVLVHSRACVCCTCFPFINIDRLNTPQQQAQLEWRACFVDFEEDGGCEEDAKPAFEGVNASICFLTAPTSLWMVQRQSHQRPAVRHSVQPLILRGHADKRGLHTGGCRPDRG